MVEVTRVNFDEYLEELFENIRHAEYVAIDTNAEVTGFLMPDESFNPELIRQTRKQDWYKKILEKQKTKSLMDFGVTIFKRNENDSLNHFTVRAYSIPMLFAYVEEHDDRPNSLSPGEEMLEIDNIGMEFIQRTKLDLNKVLYFGTPFMNQTRQENAVRYMASNPEFMTLQSQEDTNGDLDVYYFPQVIKKLTPENIETIVTRLRGISKFFDVIADTKIPVVGHNLLIKLIMLYKEFVDYLPKEFPEFLSKLENVLPQFYDTKFMASSMSLNTFVGIKGETKILLQNHGLFELYRNLVDVGKDQFQFELDQETAELYMIDLEDIVVEKLELDSESFCHESGFDACITGIIFGKLACLSQEQNDPGNRLFDETFFKERVFQWKNKFFVPKELEIDFFDSLNGLSQEFNRKNVLT